MAPPVGIALGSEHAVGAKLGQGAFGQVHVVVTRNNKTATAWACKLTPVPTKPTKKRNSEPEVAMNRLSAEHLLYVTHLRPLCGTMIPKLPSQEKDGLSDRYNNVGGYSVLVMELMQGGLLFDALPKLVASASNKNSSSIDLGPIAVRLMEIIEAIHDKFLIVMDVKPDNLMLTSLDSSSKATSKKKNASAAAANSSIVTPQSLADGVRMIDLGLIKSFGDFKYHKPNVGGQPVQGTPLYCSLNAHAGETPSRRDDVEAMLYVIVDMLRSVTALASNSSSSSATNSKKKAPPSGTTTLPWSNEKSDEAIGKAKKQQVLDRKSAFYSEMPKPAADILFELLQTVRAYKYKEDPDHQGLCARLALLKVPLAKKKATAAAKKKAPPRAAAASKAKGTPRRTTRSRAAADLDDSDDDDESPPAARQKTSHSKDDEFDSDVSMEDAANDDGDDDEEDSVSPMEVDSCSDDEVEEIEAPTAATSKKNQKFYGVKLLVSDPKQSKTTTIYLVRGATESTELKDGKSAAALTLSGNKHGGVSVLSTGKHKKECPAKVDNKNVPVSGTVAFWSQTVKIGKLVVEVKKTTKSEYNKWEGEKKPAAKKKKGAAQAGTTATRSTTTRSAMKDTDNNVEKKPAMASKKKESCTVTVVTRNDDDEEEQFVLENGFCDTVTLGSAPKGKGEKVVVPGLPASLVRLDLEVQKTGCMVKVTNLQSKKSSSNFPVRIDTTPIAPGAWQAAFPGTRVMLGDETTLNIA